MIHYDLYLAEPEGHIIKILLTLQQPDLKGEEVFMPAWIPGSYMIRDFSKHIVSIKASQAGQPVSIQKRDSHSYDVQPQNQQPLIIEYEIYAFDRSVRGAHFDLTHAFVNGTSVFLSVASKSDSLHTVSLHSPRKTYQNQVWSVATALPIKEVDANGFGTYQAHSYEDLIDYPIEMGVFEKLSFRVEGREHRLALTGRHDGDLKRLSSDMSKLCQAAYNLFQAFPFDNYLFLLTVLENGYGGLEHQSSTALISQKASLPIVDLKEANKEYQVLLGLISHEYFHAWNVKKIRPQEYCSPDLRRPAYSEQLWAFEGITSYYDDLLLLRAKCIGVKDYLLLLSDAITKYLDNLGRYRQTIKESSFDAWTKFYQPNENSQNTIVNYYTKGSLCALLFDLQIRLSSQSQASLDDVMRALWLEFGKESKGVPNGAIEAFLIRQGGESLRDLVHLCLDTTEELPLVELFRSFGVAMTLENELDLRGARAPVSLGIGVDLGNPCKITSVAYQSSAYRAGLSALDTLVALDGAAINAKNFMTLLARKKPGDTGMIHVFREENLLQFELEFEAKKATKCSLALIDSLTDEQQRLRTSWLDA